MNKIFFLICVMSLWSHAAYGHRHAEEAFLQANSMYEEDNIQGARDLYESIKNKGEAVWYNLGVCYYRTSNMPMALYSFLQAQRQSSWYNSLDILHALEKTKKSLGTYTHSWIISINNAVYRITTLLSLFGWQLLLIIAWFLLVCIMALWYKKRRYILLIFSFCFMLLMAFLVTVKYTLLYQPHAVIISSVQLMVGPDENFSSLVKLSPGCQVVVNNYKDGWYKIMDGNHSGWVPVDSLKLVNAW